MLKKIKRIYCYFTGHVWEPAKYDSEFMYVCKRCNKIIDTGF